MTPAVWVAAIAAASTIIAAIVAVVGKQVDGTRGSSMVDQATAIVAHWREIAVDQAARLDAAESRLACLEESTERDQVQLRWLRRRVRELTEHIRSLGHDVPDPATPDPGGTP